MNSATALAVIKLLDLVVTGITLGPTIKALYEANRNKLNKMIEEGRDPTHEEWEELLGKINSSKLG